MAEFKIGYVADFIPDVAPKMVRAGMDILNPAVDAALDDALIKGQSKRRGVQAGYKYSTGFTRSRLRRSNVFYRNNATRFTSNTYFEGSERGSDNPSWRASMMRRRKDFISSAVRKTKAQVEDAMTRVFEMETGNLND